MSKVNYLAGMRVSEMEVMRACADILSNDERQTPVVAEDVFEHQIVPLLQRPWDENNLARYKRYVVELTMPLRVAGVRDGKTVTLFTVPPLHARVDTSMSSTNGGITVNHLIEHASMLRHRGTNEPVEQYITEYLHQISQIVPIEEKLLVPVGAILALYGKTFLDDEGNPLYSLDGSPITTTTSSTGEVIQLAGDPFQSDGLLDED
jgi:hypothetical protein